MIGIKCFDSSAWLAYYFGESEEVRDVVESACPLITSVLSLFEVKKRLLSLKKDSAELLTFMKQRSGIIGVDDVLAEKAAEISRKNKLAAMDALIYTTSVIHQAVLWTGDGDFENVENVKMIG